jgi:hypothetical protein
MVPYSFIRIEVANRLIGTTWGESLAALSSAASAVAGILLFALPVRLLLDGGFLRMAAVAVAGVVGAVVGVSVGARSTYGELKDLALKAAGR